MPRQAARLVLGRSARAKPPTTTSYQPFSTTPRHFDDLNNGNNNRSNNDRSSRDTNTPLSRQARDTAAVSALGAFRGSTASPAPAIGPFGGLSIMRTPPGLARPGSNIIRPPAQLGGDRPAPGTPGFVPRFGGRSNNGGRDTGGGFTGGRSNSLRGDRGRGRGRPRGGRGGRGGGRGGGGGGSQGMSDKFQLGKMGKKVMGDDSARGRGSKSASALAEELLNSDGGGHGEHIDVILENERTHGPERQYQPALTLESLVQWGPAVATNNALGQASTALRSMRLVAGGRRFADFEQTFDIEDEVRWRSAGKPIFYSRPEQKWAALRMLKLAPEQREKMVQAAIEKFVKGLQLKHGKNYQAFAKAYDKLGEAGVRRQAEESVEREFEALVDDEKNVRSKNETVKEAIARLVLKGEHPPVKPADDILGNAARYHAQTPTYTPLDGDKFNAKLKQLVRS